jgi:hypothetical protein
MEPVSPLVVMLPGLDTRVRPGAISMNIVAEQVADVAP